jgi:hypothetical protein
MYYELPHKIKTKLPIYYTEKTVHSIFPAPHCFSRSLPVGRRGVRVRQPCHPFLGLVVIKVQQPKRSHAMTTVAAASGCPSTPGGGVFAPAMRWTPPLPPPQVGTCWNSSMRRRRTTLHCSASHERERTPAMEAPVCSTLAMAFSGSRNALK